MKRTLKWLVLTNVLLLLAVTMLWWWLFGTRSGAEWTLGQVQNRVQQLSWSGLEGSFSDGLIIRDLNVDQAGLKLGVGRTELTVNVRPGSPLRVNVLHLHLDQADIRLPPTDPEAPDSGLLTLGGYASPVHVSIADLVVREVVIRAADSEPINIQNVRFSGRYAETLEIEQLQLDSMPFQLQINGEQGLSTPWASDLSVRLNWQIGERALQTFDLNMAGTLDALQMDVMAQGPVNGRSQIMLKGLPDIDQTRAEVGFNGSLNQWPGLDAAANEIILSVQGTIDDWRADVSAQVSRLNWPTARIDLQVDGGSQIIRIQRGQLQVLEGQIALSGEADLGSPLSATAQIELTDLDFTALYPEWPDQAQVSGGMSLTLQNERILIENLQLRAPPSALNLSGQAEMNLDTEALHVTLDWQSLAWPPVSDAAEAEPLFTSQSGQFEADGTLHQWRAEIEAMLALPGRFNRLRGDLELDANGDAG